MHRVVEPAGVLPQAADRLDPDPVIGADEVRIRVERLNLDAASFHQLRTEHGGDGGLVRAAVLDIVGRRGKMHNPVTGSGGMLIGTVEAVGPASPLGLRAGDRVATLVSLTLTPLRIADDLRDWDGLSEQVPCDGHAILFARSIAAVLPGDLDPQLALAVLDVCGAPALVARVVRQSLRDRAAATGPLTVAVLGAAGKSGSLALAAARDAAGDARDVARDVARDAGAVVDDAGVTVRAVGVVRDDTERARLTAAGLADTVTVADARDAVGLAAALDRTGGPADVTVVCVDVPGCEHAAVLATAPGGTVIFFSMATSFPAAALGAEGLAADVTMLIGNGYVPGHADYALRLLRTDAGVRDLFQARLRTEAPPGLAD
ncbi:L-erythro-3,5-diaminohexanoate dehydrogenase [Dactylosporangium siamense]|uniref:L-erythro-3,5-diaminohexanoate dehydrogenase n=1 Tax=Dactylosporangium siamense TaxID=685454 RepID=A0A919UEN0_9ACTN|nr:L-erythro-3,5-diaminohexanoate dehydrogenase [Dactylosporangium siamense]